MKKFTFKGLMAPVFTPFTNDSSRSLKLNAIQPYAKFLAESGIKAVLVNGTTGEGMAMNVDERKLVTEAWVKAVRELKLTIMVQVGGTCLKNVRELARHAESLDVDALLCLPDLFYRPANPNQVADYLKFVSDAAPNTPLFYYHLPGFTGINLSISELFEVAGDKVPTFCGAKFTHNDMQDGNRCLQVKNGAYQIFLGNDELMMGAYAMGWDSAIGTTLNMLAKPCIDIVEATTKGRMEEAKRSQNALTAAVRAITKNASWIEGMKAAMALLTPLDLGPPRQPLQPLSGEKLKELRQDLVALKLLKN